MSQSALSDSALLDLVQRQTLSYFWDFAHPTSGMARERSNPDPNYDYLDTVTSGGTGFGIMAMLAGVARGFLPRGDVLKRIATIADLQFFRAERLAAPERVCEPGLFRIEIGASSERLSSTSIEWRADQ